MLFLKIAFRNVRRQIGGYLIYFFTVALTVALLFSLSGMMFSKTVFNFSESFKLETSIVCGFLSVILAVVSALVFGYGSSFLLRRRKKEFGTYLTLGMTRADIIAVFALEMLFTFLFSLAAGLGLGMLVYQALATGISSFMGVDVAWADYTAEAFILTVVLVSIVFFITWGSSSGYLQFEKISNLLKGENTKGKKVKHPRLWLYVTIVSFIVLVLATIVVTVAASGHPGGGAYVFTIIGGSAVVVLAIVFTYVGALKSGTHYMLENKHFSGKGVRTFTLRQLSDRMNSDSVFFGVIAVLLSIVIVGGNFFMTIFGTQVALSKRDNPYTVSVSFPYDETGELTKDIPVWMQDFGTVEKLRQYTVFELDDLSMVHYLHGNPKLLRESDYYALAEMAGEKADPLNGGALMICNGVSLDELEEVRRDVEEFIGNLSWETDDFSITFNGVSSTHNRLVVCGSLRILAVPDSVMDAVEEAKIYSSAFMSCAVNYKGGSFEKEEMENFFMAKNDEDAYKNFPHDNGFGSSLFFNVDISGSFLPYLREISTPWLMIVLFVTLAFALLSMAVLSLKTLAAVAENKRRYRLLYLAGASKKQTLFSLFVQTALYFFLPFAVPILLNVPVTFICVGLNGMMGGALTALQVIGYAATLSGILLLFYALYCAVTCIVAGVDVRRELRASGRVT